MTSLTNLMELVDEWVKIIDQTDECYAAINRGIEVSCPRALWARPFVLDFLEWVEAKEKKALKRKSNKTI